MRQLKRLKTSVLGVAVLTAPVAILVFGVGTAAAQPSPSPSPSPSPNPNNPRKVTIDNTNRDCFGNVVQPPGTGTGSGLAIINAPAGKKVIANVVLTNAAPNSTYGVRLIQTFTPPSNQDCGDFSGQNPPYEATLQTDASGNGQVNVHEPVLPGADDAFVALNNTTAPATDFYTSPDVPFSSGD